MSSWGKRHGVSQSQMDERPSEQRFSDVLEAIDIRNIDFDPHIHTFLSDGIDDSHEIINLANRIGLNAVAFSDHHRDSLEDVKLYNTDAYRILDFEGDNRLSSNMFLLDEISSIFQEQGEERISSEEVLDALENYSSNYGVQYDPSEADSIMENLREENDSHWTELLESIERDYETWNDRKTEEFFEKYDFDLTVLSTHYLPEKFIEENNHEEQNQYIRGADLQHLEKLSSEYSPRDVVEWYLAETKTKLLRAADLTELDDLEVEKLYERHADNDEVRLDREIGVLKQPVAGETPVIHSHWDLILTTPHLRPYVSADEVDEYLDLAEQLGEIVEVNGRTLMKQRKAFSSDQNFYAPEDGEWYAREVLERAENGDLQFTVGSDAHSLTEMFQHYDVIDNLLEDYNVRPHDDETLGLYE